MKTAKDPYAEALRAIDQGNYACACPELDRVVELEPGATGARLERAKCYEGWGRLGVAWLAFADAEDTAQRAGEKSRVAQDAKGRATQEARAQQAKERMQALTPRIWHTTHVMIDVPADLRGLPELQVQIDAFRIGVTRWGTQIPVEKGRHVIKATAEGRTPWEKTIEVSADGDELTFTIDLKDPAAERRKLQEQQRQLEDDRLREEESLRNEEWLKEYERRVGPRRIAGFVTAGVGLVSLGVATALGAMAVQRKNESDADGHCTALKVCDDTGGALRAESRTFGDGSTAMFIVGGTVTVVGASLLLTSLPRRQAPPASARLMLGLGRIEFSGTW